jgi:uncharacterized membrane protein YhaH (DUF805 family)
MSEIAQHLVPLQTGGGGGGAGVVGIVLLLLYLAVIVAVIAGTWKAFQKADQPGWAAIIPIYNVYIMIKIGGNEWWWLVLTFIPIINIIALFKISIDVAKGFGQGLGFGLGLAILSFIFWPLLGFGDYDYQGSPGAGEAAI